LPHTARIAISSANLKAFLPTFWVTCPDWVSLGCRAKLSAQGLKKELGTGKQDREGEVKGQTGAQQLQINVNMGFMTVIPM